MVIISAQDGYDSPPDSRPTALLTDSNHLSDNRFRLSPVYREKGPGSPADPDAFKGSRRGPPPD
jgi:hypothetical protein